jgi:hypothetical protein
VEHGFEAMRTLGPRRDLIDIESGEVVERRGLPGTGSS